MAFVIGSPGGTAPWLGARRRLGRGRARERAIVVSMIRSRRSFRVRTGAATILLVDDEDSVQKLLTYPLEREGYRVIQARSGEEALERFDADQPISSCWTSCCRGSTGSRFAAGCAP